MELVLPPETGCLLADGAFECDLLDGDFWRPLLLNVRSSAGL